MSKVHVTRQMGPGPCGRCNGCKPKDGGMPSPCDHGAVVDVVEVSRRKFTDVPPAEKVGPLAGAMVALSMPDGAGVCSYGDIEFAVRDGVASVPSGIAGVLVASHGYTAWTSPAKARR